MRKNNKIQKKNKKLALSQNKSIKTLLENSLSDEKNKRAEEFKDLFGTWSREDEEQLEKQIDDLEKS